jgi:antitoxin (DNA-binding transcriptional repressor) of toxin-antitoxin stability system
MNNAEQARIFLVTATSSFLEQNRVDRAKDMLPLWMSRSDHARGNGGDRTPVGPFGIRIRLSEDVPPHRTKPGLRPRVPRAMCHKVHMKTISIRELHLETGRWVRHAASRGPIVVTDRGRRVAALQPFDASMTGRPLPNREAAIRKRSKVPVDSAVYQSELREDR